MNLVIVLLGASGTGKSTIETELAMHYGYNKIVSYTTRPKRENETDGVDYHFISNDTFNDIRNQGLFAEFDEYSQNRFYGTLCTDYCDGNKTVVLTPNGLRQIKDKSIDKVFSVLVNVDLGTRIKRYIDRCGVSNFTYDDKNEICARVERDFGMFLGLEKEVNYVVNNNEGTDIRELAKEIANMAEMYNVKEY